MQKLGVSIVTRENMEFTAGRRLARKTYSHSWGTDPSKMTDDYDAAIVATIGGKVVGNINIKSRVASGLLPSEHYFGDRHWSDQCIDVAPQHIAELCSFAADEGLSGQDRLRVFRGVILGTHLFALQNQISLFATVQRRELFMTLIRILKYPFFKNPNASCRGENIPDDRYWQEDPPPSLYYSYTNTPQAYFASLRLLSGLVLEGVSLTGVIAPQELPTSLGTLASASQNG